jgi:hypothetical protein
LARREEGFFDMVGWMGLCGDHGGQRFFVLKANLAGGLPQLQPFDGQHIFLCRHTIGLKIFLFIFPF